jgi:hypothetical protein
MPVGRGSQELSGVLIGTSVNTFFYEPQRIEESAEVKVALATPVPAG